MTNLNKFADLSNSDKKFIVDLSEKHTLSEAIDILKQPRPVGLALITSISGLHRFLARYHPDLKENHLLTQFSRVLQISRQAAPGAHLAAILSLAETRLLSQLKAGRALADLTSEARTLKFLHGTWAADLRLRYDLGDSFQFEYRKILKKGDMDPDADFLRADLEQDPGAGDATPEDFDPMDQEAEDRAHQRETTEMEMKAQARARNLQRALASKAPAPSIPQPVALPAPPVKNPTPISPKPAVFSPFSPISNPEISTPPALTPADIESVINKVYALKPGSHRGDSLVLFTPPAASLSDFFARKAA